MLWRTAIAAATVATLVDVTPAVAQFYGDQGFGRHRFWEQRPRGSQQWRADEWGYGDYRRTPITRSGGARPMITPAAPPKVPFHSNFTANSVVIDSEGRTLYFILSSSEAYQYPISVGREGFSWIGTEVVSRQQTWPDWHPPKEMIARDPRLPDKMTGGVKNPLGAQALYLGNTLYRIHGTNDPKTIGQAASSGCFRMMNEHVMHLATLATVGTPVTVVKHLPTQMVAAPATPPVVEAAPEEDDPYATAPDRYPDDDYDDQPPRGYDRYRYDRYGDPL